MEWIYVSSSNVVRLRYDADNALLEVEFKSGTYQYLDVPINIGEELLAAAQNGESVGKFIASRIKGTFRFVRI